MRVSRRASPTSGQPQCCVCHVSCSDMLIRYSSMVTTSDGTCISLQRVLRTSGQVKPCQTATSDQWTTLHPQTSCVQPTVSRKKLRSVLLLDATLHPLDPFLRVHCFCNDVLPFSTQDQRRTGPPWSLWLRRSRSGPVSKRIATAKRLQGFCFSAVQLCNLNAGCRMSRANVLGQCSRRASRSPCCILC